METTNPQRISPPIVIAFWDGLDGAARRIMDIVASAIGLLLLGPLFFLVALAIKRDSPGPVFYRGPRMGRYGQRFGILKFRTMYERPDSYQGPRITSHGDQRVTPLGQWLRETKINELPQLWNVLVGEMSLVGPRPEDPEIAERWPEALRERLLSVRPGITSPATVVFRSEEEMLQSANPMDDYFKTILPDKLRLDSIYVRNRNVLTDLDVIFMTLVMLLPRLRKNDVQETTLYWGPLAQFFSRYFNWFVIDTLIALSAVTLAGLLWRLEAPLNVGWNVFLAISFVVSFCFSLTNMLLGLNQVQWRRAPVNEVFPLAMSAGVATFLLVLFDFAFRGPQSPLVTPHLPIGMLIVSGLLAFLGFTALRYRERLVTGLATQWLQIRKGGSVMGERVLIVGAGSGSQFATWLFTRSDLARLFTIIGMVDDDPRDQGMLIDGFRVLGTTRDISMLVAKHDIGLVLYTIKDINEAERRRILNACQSTHAMVAVLPDVLTELRDYFLFDEKIYLPHRQAADAGD